MLLYIAILCFLVPLALVLQKRSHAKRMDEHRRAQLRRRIEEKERAASARQVGEEAAPASAEAKHNEASEGLQRTTDGDGDPSDGRD